MPLERGPKIQLDARVCMRDNDIYGDAEVRVVAAASAYVISTVDLPVAAYLNYRACLLPHNLSLYRQKQRFTLPIIEHVRLGCDLYIAVRR